MAWPWSPNSVKLKDEADKYRKLSTNITTWSDSLNNQITNLKNNYIIAEEKVFTQETEYIGELNEKYFSTVRPHMKSVIDLIGEIEGKIQD